MIDSGSLRAAAPNIADRLRPIVAAVSSAAPAEVHLAPRLRECATLLKLFAGAASGSGNRPL